MNNYRSVLAPSTSGARGRVNSRFNIRIRARNLARHFGILFTACVSTLLPLPAQAALLSLSETPLFLQNAVQPNIFFMLDDSGSMDWETVYNPGTQCNSANGTSALDFTPDTSGSLAGCPSGGGTPLTYTIVQVERLRLCVGFNTLAYNPAVTYTPWYGKDNAGTPVTYKNAWLYGSGTNASPNFNVRQDPYTTGSATTNLDAAGVVAYRPWTDSNGNGDYNDGECGDKNTSTANVLFSSLTESGGDPTTSAADLVANQKKNFANWYMYYRKREYVMKRAISEIVQNGRQRMGMSTLWRNNSVGIQVENIDDISIPINATAVTNKTNLLNQVNRINSTNGTPLRNALDRVGRYFDGSDGSPNTSTWNSAKTALFGATTAPSPILSSASGGTCQQNFQVMMTDGYYNSGYSGTTVGNADGDSSSVFDSGSTGAAARPYGDNQSNTLADIAMYYYERDLRSDLANKVPYTTGFDPLTPGAATPGDAATDDQGPPTAGITMHQHLVTYTVAFGLSGNLDPFNATASLCDSDSTNACWVGWPNVTPASMEDTDNAVDDLWHAARNSRGLFLSGRNPALLAAALNSAIADISGRTGTASSVAASASSASTSSRLYVPQFTSGEWSGSLIALGFQETAPDSGVFQLVDVTDWTSPVSDAGEVLKTQNFDTGRNILTWNGTIGVPFRWANLVASQQTALNINPTTALNDAKGSERLNFIRGDHSLEKPTGTYRQRTNSTVLGDTVNSAAIYVQAPGAFYPDSIEAAPWSTFRTTYINRTPMIYVGANDGMLHAFAACITASNPVGCTASDLGREKFGYVPNRLFGKLNRLPDPAYAHSYYVDGTPTVADVFYAGSWHTILVGSLRGGGQGIFALDVTNPAAFSEGNANSVVRWEFTDANDADLGYTFSQPVIAKLNDGRWAAIFGNGYNNSEADGAASVTGLASLFVVDIETGALIRKITVPAGTVATPNGLATPRVIDANSDFKSDIVYAGDLQGNMWKFDLRSNTPGSWTAQKLFTATDPLLNPQPITSKPVVTYHPAGVTGYLVAFGTGKYIEGGATDTANTQVQTFYGIWDQQGSAGGATLVANSALISQTLSQTTVGGFPARTTTSNTIASWGTGGGQNMGWKVNFALSTGERVVSNPQYLSDGRLLFVGIIPDTDPCNYGGTSWIYQFNTTNGGAPPFTVFDVNNDGSFNSTDNSSGRVVVGVQVGGIAPQPLVLDTENGRLIVTPSTQTSNSKDSRLERTDKDKTHGRQGWRQIQ